jgi:hypothetical protein
MEPLRLTLSTPSMHQKGAAVTQKASRMTRASVNVDASSGRDDAFFVSDDTSSGNDDAKSVTREGPDPQR